MKKYEIVKEYLLTHIKNGDYKMGGNIPAERELASILGMNRMTVRRAIEELVVDGMLVSKIGSGTYVCGQTPKESAQVMTHSMMMGQTIKVLDIKETSGHSIGIQYLSLKAEEKCLRMRRRVTLNGTYYSYEDIYFSLTYFSEMVSEDYELGIRKLATKYAQTGLVVRREVEAQICLHNTAKILNIEEGSPILQINTLIECKGIPILYCRSNHPGYHYKYESEPFEISQSHLSL